MSHKTKKLLRKLGDVSRPLRPDEKARLERKLAAFNAHQARNVAKAEPTRRTKEFTPQAPQDWRVNEPAIVQRPLRQIAINGSMDEVNNLLATQRVSGASPKHVLDRVAASVRGDDEK